jgi:hypothetical protein
MRIFEVAVPRASNKFWSNFFSRARARSQAALEQGVHVTIHTSARKSPLYDYCRDVNTEYYHL